LLILEQIVERPQRKQIAPVVVVESSRRPICMGAVMVDFYNWNVFLFNALLYSPCCKEERGRSKMEVEEKQAYVSAWQW